MRGTQQAALLLAFCLAIHSRSSARDLAAFPGAVGQGAVATGGRGGDVYHVTNLDDYDPKKGQEKIPGSLRHAIRSTEGPRTIVFDVGGAIALAGPLEIIKDHITIAGQTAPGGITLWGYPTEISQSSDVVVRHVRFRCGDFHVAGGNKDLDPRTASGLEVANGSQRIILDHVSVAWGIDETLSVTRCRDVTVQHSIIAESLNDSSHPKGEHGYGSLVRGEVTADDQRLGTGGYTFYGNLWAHHRARMPSIGGQQKLQEGQSEAQRRRTDVNLVNNVIYNWESQATHRSGEGQVRINLVGNYYINGPTKKADYFFRENIEDVTAVYHAANAQDANRNGSHDGQIVESDKGFRDFGNEDELIGPDGSPFGFFASVEPYVVSANDAYERVVESAGASLARDPIDQRIIQSVRERSGTLVDTQQRFRDESGHLPGIDNQPQTRRPANFDTDQDGMPDSFERARKLNPSDPSDGNETNLSKDGYTNLEVYLDALATNPGVQR